VILLIYAFWVARITGMSHQCPTLLYFLVVVLSYLGAGMENMSY
jgi:hypothetical protein